VAEVMRHNSSYLDETEYDAQSETLDVTFTDGRQYRYSGVPRGIYTQFITSPSKGSAFHRLIRDRYDAEEL
jgi:hypothetical protein